MEQLIFSQEFIDFVRSNLGKRASTSDTLIPFDAKQTALFTEAIGLVNDAIIHSFSISRPILSPHQNEK